MSVAPLPRRALIVSGHPLFSAGLRNLLRERQPAGVGVEVVGLANNMEEVVATLDSLKPDIVIVDYDDKAINRQEFLARFVEGVTPMRVVLASLKDGGEVVMYDRRTLSAAQVEDWLEVALSDVRFPESKSESLK
jgi:DNA-binding NarL/FixJ family response regulator